MDRKDFFKTGLTQTAKSLYNSRIGAIIDQQLQSFVNFLEPFAQPARNPASSSKKTDNAASGFHPETQSDDGREAATPVKKKRGFPRPPGSVRDPERFRQICTECGDCIIACPYGAILRAPGIYGPVMDPNLAACALCKDYPCIQACDERALLPIPEGFLPKFGHAILNPQLCRNVPGKQENQTAGKKSGKSAARKAKSKKLCRACVEICPIPDAVSLLKGPIRIPAFAHHCTGCGLCVHECPESAIRIDYAI
jgi:ferredoxin-type protein NapG